MTDNYLYPFFHLRSGGNVTGWQFWPVAGGRTEDARDGHQQLGSRLRRRGATDKFFAVWPFFFKDRSGLGTTNEEDRLAVVPFYSRLRSPLRDESCYGWPFGYWRIDDRGKKVREQDFLWPFFEVARGEKTVTRIFPFYSRGTGAGLENDFYLWPLYKFLRIGTPAMERQRTRIAFFLYSDIREKNRPNGGQLHRVDFWPFFTCRRDMEQKERLQVLALLEPFFPSNREHHAGLFAALVALAGGKRRQDRRGQPVAAVEPLPARERPRDRKNTRSCLVFFSINQAAKAHTGACATFRLEKRTARRGRGPVVICFKISAKS